MNPKANTVYYTLGAKNTGELWGYGAEIISPISHALKSSK